MQDVLGGILGGRKKDNDNAMKRNVQNLQLH
jgi:hypothetical protein